MKRSFSFLVKVADYYGGKACKSIDSGDHQPTEDYKALNKYSPFPKNGKRFKITYTLAPETGEFRVVRSSVGLHFKFADEEIVVPGGYFVNCLLENTEWPKGIRFNRKVEIIKRGSK